MADKIESRVEQIADTVEKLADSTADAVSEVREEVKVLVQSWERDQKDLKAALENGAKFDAKEAEKIVAAIMEKKEADEKAKNILAGGVANKSICDPWDRKSDYLAWESRKEDGKSYLPILNAALRSTASTDMHKYLQHMAVDIAIANALGEAWSRTAGEQYRGFAHHFPNMHKKWMNHQAAFLADFTGKATVAPMDLSDTSTWVPSILSPEIRDKIMLATSVGSLFEHLTYTGPGTTWELPVDLTDAVADYITETTAYAAGLPYQAADPIQLGQALTDAKATYAFKKHRSRFIFSGELAEDSVISILPQVRKKLIETLAHGEEDAWINGQKTASIDTGAAAPGTYSVRKAHDGIRYFCSSGVANSLVDAGSDNLAYADIMAARAKMGELGVNPSDLALILGPSGYMQALKISEVLTMEKFGSNAAVVQGQLAAIAGIPIVVSRYVPEDMNASGIRDATTTTETIALVVNRRAWLAVEKRDVTIESVRLPQTDQTDVIAMRRFDLGNIFGSTILSSCVIYNLDTALA